MQKNLQSSRISKSSITDNAKFCFGQLVHWKQLSDEFFSPSLLDVTKPSTDTDYTNIIFQELPTRK